MSTKLISWKLNKRIESEKSQLNSILKNEDPDILCLQAMIQDELVFSKEHIPFPESYFHETNTYRSVTQSGTCTLFKNKPNAIIKSFNFPDFEDSGMIMILEYDKFVLFNCHVPGNRANQSSGKLKEQFHLALQDKASSYLSQNRSVIVSGYLAVAHSPLDQYAGEKCKSTGFYDYERAYLADLEQMGLIDSFRFLNPDTRKYTWWPSNKKFENNEGWRMDYFFVSSDLKDKIIAADIHSELAEGLRVPISLILDI